MMRRILVDYARSKRYLKRGGGAEKISIDDIDHEDLQSLLFSVAIHKNQEVVDWLEKYKKFIIKRKEVRKIFETALKWL